MKNDRLWLVVVSLILIAGCGKKAPPDESKSAEIAARVRLTGTQTITPSLTLPSGMTAAGFLVGQNEVQLDSTITVAGPVWSAGTLFMQPDVNVPAAVVATGNVTLADRDTITSLTYGGTLTRGNGDSIGTSTHASLTNATRSTSGRGVPHRDRLRRVRGRGVDGQENPRESDRRAVSTTCLSLRASGTSAARNRHRCR